MDAVYVKEKLPVCERCGFCCIIAPCSFGDDKNTDGRCSHLKIKENIASCLILKKGKATKDELRIGSGCWLREKPESFNLILESMSDLRNNICIKKMEV